MAQAREEAGDSRLMSGREISRIIRVSVKTPQDFQEFMLSENSSVRHFKKQISKRLHCDTDRLVLIFTGKILRDQDTLSQRGILDGDTVHLVVRNRLKGTLSNSGSHPGPTCPCTQSTESSTSKSVRRAAKLSHVVRNSSDLANFLAQLAQLLMAPPESVLQFLEDPLLQGLTQEKSANTSHVPESSRPFQKPEPALKAPETLQIPAPKQELLPTAKAELETPKAAPGGDNVLPQVGSEVQQLMLCTLAPLVSCKSHSLGSEHCREVANTHTSNTDATATNPAALAPVRLLMQDIRAGKPAHVKSTASNQTSSESKNGMLDYHSAQNPPSQGNQQPKGKANPANLLKPSSSDLRKALHILQQNPALLHQLTVGSPLRHHIPLLPILTNPRALQALIQIEKGLQTLSREVPGLGPCLWSTGRPHGAREVPETRGGGQDYRAENPVQPTMAILKLLHALANAYSQPTQSSPSSLPLTEGLYQQELEHLKAMGFVNHDANLQALIATSEDIHAAIERLLGTPEL